MNYEIALITDPTRCSGFELAGIGGIYAVETKEEAMEILLNILKNRNIGIVIISDQLLPENAEFDNLMARSFPAIISVPTTGKDRGSKSSLHLQEFIKRSIGISIKM